METKKPNAVLAALIGAIFTVILSFIFDAIYNLLVNFLIYTFGVQIMGTIIPTIISAIFDIICFCVGLAVAAKIVGKNTRFSFGGILLGGVIYAVVVAVVANILSRLIIYNGIATIYMVSLLLRGFDAIMSFLFGILALKIAKYGAAPQPVYTAPAAGAYTPPPGYNPPNSAGGYNPPPGYTPPNSAGGYNPPPGYNPPNVQNATIPPEEVEPLCAALLGAIKPSLKAPLTAVLCGIDEMRITCQNGVYSIAGYVSSQNSYGAMIKTDFSAQATRVGDNWVISNVKVGVQAAKDTAKSFATNYILISIFVGVMALLGYFILSMLI